MLRLLHFAVAILVLPFRSNGRIEAENALQAHCTFDLLMKGAANRGGLRIEALCGQSKKMADGARLVCDFQSPLRTVAKSCDDVADHVRAYGCGLVPSRVIIRQINAHVV